MIDPKVAREFNTPASTATPFYDAESMHILHANGNGDFVLILNSESLAQRPNQEADGSYRH